MILSGVIVVILITICVWLFINLSKHNTVGFLEAVLFLGLFGIVCEIITFYMKNGFDLYLNLFCLFPFYAFILWVIYKVYPIIKHSLKEH